MNSPSFPKIDFLTSVNSDLEAEVIFSARRIALSFERIRASNWFWVLTIWAGDNPVPTPVNWLLCLLKDAASWCILCANDWPLTVVCINWSRLVKRSCLSCLNVPNFVLYSANCGLRASLPVWASAIFVWAIAVFCSVLWIIWFKLLKETVNIVAWDKTELSTLIPWSSSLFSPWNEVVNIPIPETRKPAEANPPNPPEGIPTLPPVWNRLYCLLRLLRFSGPTALTALRFKTNSPGSSRLGTRSPEPTPGTNEPDWKENISLINLLRCGIFSILANISAKTSSGSERYCLYDSGKYSFGTL